MKDEQITLDKLNEHFEFELALANQAMKGKKLEELAKTGYVEPPRYERKIDPEEDENIRRIAVKLIHAHFNKCKSEIYIQALVTQIRSYCANLQKNGPSESDFLMGIIWKSSWHIPSRRTCERRINETPHPEFYPDHHPLVACLKAGYYRPQLTEEQRVAIVEEVEKK